MLRPIKNIKDIKAGDRVVLETNKGSEKYEGMLTRTAKSTTVRDGTVFTFSSGYSFVVVEVSLMSERKLSGDLWRLVSATREVPDVVPGTIGDADFGGEGCPVQRISSVPNSDPFGEPFVWMSLQDGALMSEADVIEFRPDPRYTTQWANSEVPFANE